MKKLSKLTAFIMTVFMLVGMWAFPAEAAVVPEMPKNLEAEAYSAQAIELYWDEAQYADGYRVYIRKNGKWNGLCNVKEGYYLATGLTASTKYTFAVRSYRKQTEGVTWSEKFAKVSVKTDKMRDRPLLKAVPHTTSAALSWSKVEGASGYRVYIRQNKKWVKLADVSKETFSYTVTGLEGLTTYAFTVKPFARATGGVQWGKLAKTVKATTKDPTQVQLKATANESSITLSWDKVSGAKGYRVYIRENNKWKSLKTLKGTSYTVTGLNSDTYYTFCAKAYKKVNGATKWFPLSKSFKYATTPVAENLTVYRIANIDKILNGDYVLETEEHSETYGDVSTVVATRNGYLHISGTGNELIDGVKVIYNAKNKKTYLVSDELKGYISADIDIFSVLLQDSERIGLTDFPIKSIRGKVNVSVEEFEGTKVICESYRDYDDIIYKYYFKNDTFIAYDIDFTEYMEEEEYDGETCFRIYVKKFTSDVPSSYFAIPSDYKLMDAEEFMDKFTY